MFILSDVLSNLLVRGTAWLCFGCYIATLIGWECRWRLPLLRTLWTLGWLIFAVHLGLAFHLVHHWSHQAAWDATQLQGGYGDGVYLNYLVGLVWGCDVLWWWMQPGGVAVRQRWIAWSIHGFLFFMWFNAAVIFARNGLGLIGLLAFSWWGWLIVQHRRRA